MRLVKLSLTLFWLLSGSVSAEPYGAADYPDIKRFPYSDIVQYSNAAESDYRFILGGLEKVNGVLRPEKEERVEGQLTQITYQIPENHLASEAFDFYLDQIKALGAEVLFECQGRACGSSNHWANDIFGYFRLYGPDVGQSYAAARADKRYFSLYSITRGNKRVFTRLEVVEAPGTSVPVPSAASVVAIPITTAADISQLAIHLKQSGDVVWLVKYAFEGATKTAQMDYAREQLTEVQNQLIALGVTPQQIRIHPLGGFILPGLATPSTEIFAYTDAYKGSGKD